MGFSVAAILFLGFDCAFLIEKLMTFALSLSDRTDYEWFRGESGVNQVVEDMHSSLQRKGKYLSAQKGILVELEIHLLLYVVLTDILKAPFSELEGG